MSVTIKLPTKISNLKAITNKAGTTTLSRDGVPNATQYEIIKDNTTLHIHYVISQIWERVQKTVPRITLTG